MTGWAYLEGLSHVATLWDLKAAASDWGLLPCFRDQWFSTVLCCLREIAFSPAEAAASMQPKPPSSSGI